MELEFLKEHFSKKDNLQMKAKKVDLAKKQ